MREVDVKGISLEKLGALLDSDRARALEDHAEAARELLDGRVVWNVNATASGGGVAEMLQGLLAYARGAGIDTRWLVLDGNAEFFAITKRIHNLLHGTSGDGRGLGERERQPYESILAQNSDELCSRIGRDDIVLLHDPQTAGMVPRLLDTGAHVIWRSHIGRDISNDQTELGWEFLRRYIEQADATVFSRQQYVPDWIAPETMRIIPPSIDPLSTKNADLEGAEVLATLGQCGLLEHPRPRDPVRFTRRDGSSGTVAPHDDLFAAGDVLPADARLVMQVSRWDTLKDMGGVLEAFADAIPGLPDDAHLLLVGPDVSGVSDDPEGAAVLDDCVARWKALAPEAQSRIHLAALPMEDTDENAHIVNALQRRANVVVQKSLVEGFGLTVTEPMWKARAVIASKVGGIQDQITDGEHGLLLDDPEDLEGFSKLVLRVLGDDDLATRMGEAAKERVREAFLGDRHLIQYVELFQQLDHHSG